MPFLINQINTSITRCAIRRPLTRNDMRQLRQFLRRFDGKLLMDLSGMTSGDCARLLLSLRPMLPRTAVYGAEVPCHAVTALPGKDFYRHDLRAFENEADALAWLEGEEVAVSSVVKQAGRRWSVV